MAHFVLHRPSAGAGQGEFWCGTCLWGLAGLRSPVPSGARTVLAGRDADRVATSDFRLVAED